ncbi:7283_t:CDS:2 [Gigaspora rosea]|nr:7283_t:CDS:2 [Gigaspora rosea]
MSTDNLQKPVDNQVSSEYQRSYSWKLPIVQVNKPPRGPSRSEYQREFTWKKSPPPTTSSTPVNELLSDSKSVPPQSTQSTQSASQSSQLSVLDNNKSIDVARLADVSVKASTTGDGFNNIRNTPEPKVINVSMELNVKQNYTVVTEPDIPNSNSGKFTSSAGTDKWKGTLRNGSIESNLDPIEKKMVVLEGSRLSKRSRCRSMYSLRDELKTKELASQLSNPYESEYNQQFLNWEEYYDHERKPLRRRGSWSAPLDNFRSLDGLDRSDPKFSESRKLQSSSNNDVTSVKSNRDRNLIRPSTSAEYRNYRSNKDYYDSPIDKFSKLNLDDYNYSSQIKNNEMQRTKSNEMQKIKSNEIQKTKSVEMQRTKSSGSSPLRKSVLNHDDLTTPDYRRRNTSNIEYPGRPRNRDTHMDERRRDYEHLYDNRQDTFYNDKIRKNDYDEKRHNKSHDDHHDEYDKHSSRSTHISDKDLYGRYTNQLSSNGHSRNTSNTSYSSTSDLDPSRSYGHSNPSYLDHIRHRATASDTSSISTPSSPATPNGFYDDDHRSRKSNGLDPRIYKEQIYSPAITSRPHTPRSNLPLEDDKDRYYRSNPSHNKYYPEDGNDDISHNYISSKRQPQPLLSILKDKSLVAKSPTPSTPRSYRSTYSSPSITRATSPTRSTYSKKHHNYNYDTSSPTLSPTYSSRPPSRATSVSSHATSIEEESVVLTDILRDADTLTLKNLTDQLKIFKHREFSPPSVVKPTSRSTPGVKSSSAPGTPNAAQKKKTIKPMTKSTKSPSSTSSVTSYRDAYRDYTRPQPTQPTKTDFSAAREALNLAKLKVEEMLELVSNNGSLY